MIDLYGDGLLCEAHYNPLMKRIGLYCEKFSIKTTPAVKENIVNVGKGIIPIQFLEGRI